MRVVWWYDGCNDRLNLRVNGCLETHVTFYEMVETFLPMYDLVMGKLMPLVFLSTPVHDETYDEMILANSIQWERR